MKRWTVFLGRTGTVLMAVGLALVLVSLIPTREETYPSYGEQQAPASQFIPSQYQMTLNPQRGMRVNVEASDEVRVCILQASFEDILNWIQDNLPEPANFSLVWETFMLEAFIGNHSGVVSYEANITGEGEFEYIPAKVEEATLILANYGSATVTYEIQISVINLFAPSRKMLMTAEIVIPVGLVFGGVWLSGFLKERQGVRMKKR